MVEAWQRSGWMMVYWIEASVVARALAPVVQGSWLIRASTDDDLARLCPGLRDRRCVETKQRQLQPAATLKRPWQTPALQPASQCGDNVTREADVGEGADEPLPGVGSGWSAEQRHLPGRKNQKAKQPHRQSLVQDQSLLK